MKLSQYLLMKSFCKTYEDMPDGAFFALAEDVHGWDVDDWVEYADYKVRELKIKKVIEY